MPGFQPLMRGDSYLGLSPQAEMGRTVGAQARGVLGRRPYPTWTIETSYLGNSAVVLKSAGHRPSTIPAWGDNPRFPYPTRDEG